MEGSLQHQEGQRNKEDMRSKEARQQLGGTTRRITSIITIGTCAFLVDYISLSGTPARLVLPFVAGPIIKMNVPAKIINNMWRRGNKVNMKKSHKTILPTNPYAEQA